MTGKAFPILHAPATNRICPPQEKRRFTSRPPMTRVFFAKACLPISVAAIGATLMLSACAGPNPYGSYSSQPQYMPPQYSPSDYAPQDYTQAPDAQPAYPPPPAPMPPADYPPPPAGYQPPPPLAPPGYQPAPADGYAQQYGTVADVQPLGSTAGPSSAIGTVVGAVLGGVIGNQFGHGHGRDAATVVGALGGAVAGNQIGQQMGAQPAGYRISVQLNDGSLRTFDTPNPGDLSPGERVRIDGNQLSRY